jgi:predicted CoA-binding protein/signal transduction histidine kinase
MYDFLKKIPLFAGLSTADMERLCQMVEVVHLPAGELLFAEGSKGDRAYVIKVGQLEILKTSGGRDVLLAVRESGEVIGEMSLLEEAPRMASVRARTDSELLAIHQEQLDEMLNTSASAARAMLHTMLSRWHATEAMLRQSEKMAQLATMTAGVAHELNNPSAAIQRGVGQLRSASTQLQQSFLNLDQLSLSRDQLALLREIEVLAQERAAQPLELDSLMRSDLEYEIETWLDDHGVEDGWRIAPSLLSLGYRTPQLDTFAEHFESSELAPMLTWVSSTYDVYSLVEGVGRGAAHISDIVKSLKKYVFLDQAPVQSIDIHEGLESTLVLLGNKLRGSIKIGRDFSAALPTIQAYGSELNQVWTALLDNAIYALDGAGEITLRTYCEGQWVTVEIEDDGPGVPTAIQPKIFDPFFTTKPPGQGAGLGLSSSYNIVVHKHRGEITVHSKPGKTLFRVKLPVNFESTTDSATALRGVRRVSSDKIRNILDTVKNIAVVGISSHEDRPAYSVPAYLQQHGYHIIPVNPNLDQVLGEKAYPNLHAIPEQVDAVLIFRPSETVPPIIDEAIEIGARVVWMQEGIINEAAAQTAQDAGLDVVMDTCMRAQHKRLAADR